MWRGSQKRPCSASSNEAFGEQLFPSFESTISAHRKSVTTLFPESMPTSLDDALTDLTNYLQTRKPPVSVKREAVDSAQWFLRETASASTGAAKHRLLFVGRTAKQAGIQLRLPSTAQNGEDFLIIHTPSGGLKLEAVGDAVNTIRRRAKELQDLKDVLAGQNIVVRDGGTLAIPLAPSSNPTILRNGLLRFVELAF